jgi:hypothetical protein
MYMSDFAANRLQIQESLQKLKIQTCFTDYNDSLKNTLRHGLFQYFFHSFYNCRGIL